ncbi:MAG: rRNA pseudouridine synthase [Verrucomicrobiae bacterium]|nr:rRNA pseudouridine synthase [Verrucomicrobiae bacterium]
MLVRLQKFLAEAGVGSRRACERLIQQGRVSVNGQLVSRLGSKVNPQADCVTVDGRPVVAAKRKIYVALHKPRGVLCTNRDTHGRKRALDLLPGRLGRLFTVGRLDADSEGLLLLTNDGDFGLRLTHPRYKKSKKYRVQVAGLWTAEKSARLVNGVFSEGERLRAESVVPLRIGRNGSELELVLREGRKRQIRRMMAVVGHRVLRLSRVAIGSVTLDGLKPGQWRYLTHEEVCSLLRDELERGDGVGGIHAERAQG